MLKSYFTVALRNIRKSAFYSAINIAGLTAGVLACLFILLYVVDELGYDHFHADADKIFRVGINGQIAGQEVHSASSAPPVAAAMVQEIPGVEAATRLSSRDGMVFKFEEKAFTENNILFADSNFFQFFSFELLQGDPATALQEPNSIVVTTELARRYFDGEAMGKILTVGNNNESFKVTGLAKLPPQQSHIEFNALISTSSDRDNFENGIWLNNSLYTYFKKNPATSLQSVDQKLEELVAKYAGPQIEQFIGVPFDKFLEQGNKYGYVSYPMLDSHLYSDWSDEISPPSSITYVYVFVAVGAFILIIACINFMNLSTARSAGRAKEVGLRKTLGSLRGQMIGQFLAESFVYALFAVLLALLCAYLLLPQFNLLAGKALTFQALISPIFVAGALVLIFVIGLMAGSYPAFYLTSFNAVEVLKGKARAGVKSKGIRSALVVFQFSLSIVLIICTLMGYQQIDYLQSRHMGLDKHNVLVINNTRRLGTNQEPFKQLVAQQNGVGSASFTNNVFPGVNNTTAFRAASDQQDHIMGTYVADYEHAEVMKFDITQGRFFSKDFPSDSSAIVVNEAAVKEFGYANPLNEEVIFFGGPQETRFRIVGVVKDFNFESYRSKVRPLVIRLTSKANSLLVRYTGSADEVVKNTENLWKQYAAGDPFEYTFLDQNFDQLFREEQRLSKLFLVFTSLAIFIACLGLFALAAFTAERRTKEIGIRKAMGASVAGITSLLTKEFTILVGVSIGIAVVPAYFIIDYWLNQFAYRLEISPAIFVWSGLGALAIAWLTVVFQSLKAAMAKPVNSLRYE